MARVELTTAENLEIDDIFYAINCDDVKVKADFKTRFSTLDQGEERRLILDLTKRFTYIPLSEYGRLLLPTVENYLHDIPGHTIIAVMNGFIKSDFGKVKSNYLISYQFKGLNLVKNVNWGKHKVSIIDDIKYLLQMKNTKDLELLLVDDFIGSGETIESAYKYIYNRFAVYKKSMPHVSVVCIVAMKKAVDLLEKMGIKIFASKILTRGISDAYSGEELEKAVTLMEKIEERLKVNQKNKFGYNQSEALVCMERCPNNTFPFFWLNLKHNNAPFRR